MVVIMNIDINIWELLFNSTIDYIGDFIMGIKAINIKIRFYI